MSESKVMELHADLSCNWLVSYVKRCRKEVGGTGAVMQSLSDPCTLGYSLIIDLSGVDKKVAGIRAEFNEPRSITPIVRTLSETLGDPVTSKRDSPSGTYTWTRSWGVLNAEIEKYGSKSLLVVTFRQPP